MRSDTSNIVIKNRRASHDYEFLEKLIAGIKLAGTEIKSIRAGKANLTTHSVHSAEVNCLLPGCIFQSITGVT